jgi:hypothetical protein
LKLVIANREYLVRDEYVRVEMRGHGESEPDVHPAAVSLDCDIQEPLDAGERDDLIESSSNLSHWHAQNRPSEIDVLSAGELRVKARADFKQTIDSSPQLNLTVTGLCDLAQEFE